MAFGESVELQAAGKHYLLFVSRSDVCRGPTAAGIFNELAVKSGLPLRARSAGMEVEDPCEASAGAVEAAETFGADISEHMSSPLDEKTLEHAVAVVCVTKYLEGAVKEYFPDFKHLVTAFEEDVPDPYGGDESDYRRSAAMIRRAVAKFFPGGDSDE